jgi:hypothetical protein
MSFDIFLHCFVNGKNRGFPIFVVEDVFGEFIESRGSGFWILCHPDGSHGDLYIDEGPLIEDFLVNRPPSDQAFWDGLLEVLRCTSSVLFWGRGTAQSWRTPRSLRNARKASSKRWGHPSL